MENCYATGTVSGNNRSGGVVGLNNDGTVRNSVALNLNVTGITNVGRVVGNNHGTVSNNRARADLTVGGFVPSGTVDGDDVTLGTSLSTVFAGWNTSTVWNIPNGNLNVGSALPRLRVFGNTHMPVLP